MLTFLLSVTKPKPSLKSKEDIEILRSGGRKLARILVALAQAVSEGLTTRSLDILARKLISRAGGEPAFLNYRPAGAASPFPAALCVSVNDEIVHGIPSDRILVTGDLVGLDLGLKYHGLYTDMAITVGVGEISTEAQALLQVTRQALVAGIAAARARATSGDIGTAISAAVSGHQKYGLVTEFGGHGVGHQVHEWPEIPNVGRRGSGVSLLPGLVIAIEPMVTIGRAAIVTAADGWTVKTKSGGLSAHFEHTVLITDDEPEILTQLKM